MALLRGSSVVTTSFRKSENATYPRPVAESRIGATGAMA
jgi:hypothetical protein